jgi:hypothetical protein
MTDTPPPGAGGVGGAASLSAALTPNLSPLTRVRDTRLIARAIREQWPIPEHVRVAIPIALCEVACSEQASFRNRIAAVRALLAADRLNLEARSRKADPLVDVNIAAAVIAAGKELEAGLRAQTTEEGSASERARITQDTSASP